MKSKTMNCVGKRKYSAGKRIYGGDLCPRSLTRTSENGDSCIMQKDAK